MATRTARSEKSAKIMKLPNKEQWKRFKDALTKRPRDLKEFADRTSSYLVGRTVNVSGLRGMFEKHEDTTKTFFSKTLLFIDKMALELPNLLNSKHIKYDVVLPSDREIGMDFCPLLESFEAPSKVFLDRRLVLSLLANCFLCSLPSTGRRDMPGNSFLDLFSAGRAPQEIAKLRMFVHYFERAMESIPTGTFEIHRCFVDSSKMTLDKWCKTDTPLGEVALVKLKYGLEETYHEDPSVLQVDFANMYLGGGVLSGGCVQEEIRFSISPELVVGMFFCPVMMDSEAIHLVGSEQFSLYKGYGFSLCYGGDFKDPTARKCDGSVRTALTAIDALDGRCMGRYFPSQWRENNILRELNKAYAGFVRENKSTKEEHYKEIATGNWGCGAFQGHIALKSVLQWIAMSVAGRKRMFYFPFDENSFANEFQVFLRQVGSYDSKLGENKRDILRKCSMLTKTNTSLTSGRLLCAVRRVAREFESAEDECGMKRKVSSKEFFDRLLKELTG